MCAQSEVSDGGLSGGPGTCRNAEQYALQRLEEEDEPMQAAELAGEYDCTNGHMRNALSKLRDEGAVERIDRGMYTVATGDETSEKPEGSGTARGEAENLNPEESGDEPRFSEDGVARSNGVDGTADEEPENDLEGVTMPTASEYEQLQEQADDEEAADGLDEDDDQEASDDDQEASDGDQEARRPDHADGDDGETETSALFPIPKTVGWLAVAVVLGILAWKIYQEYEPDQQPGQQREEHQQQQQFSGSGLTGW